MVWNVWTSKGYNLRRTHRPDYAAYFNDAEDDDADM